MPAAQWPLQNNRPVVEIVVPASGGRDRVRCFVADSGAGTRHSVFQMVVSEDDCLQGGAILIDRTRLGGAYSGVFPVYLLHVRIPKLNFDEPLPVVAVSQVPHGFDGIAGFRFLNRFHYGNFGDPAKFGLDPLPSHNHD